MMSVEDADRCKRLLLAAIRGLEQGETIAVEVELDALGVSRDGDVRRPLVAWAEARLAQLHPFTA